MCFVVAVSYRVCEDCGKRTQWVEVQDVEGYSLEMCKTCLEKQTADILQD